MQNEARREKTRKLKTEREVGEYQIVFICRRQDFYVENHKESTKKLVELKSDFGKIAGQWGSMYKINFYILATNNGRLKFIKQ